MQFAPGEPEQFCTPLDGTQDLAVLHVCAYPVAWRVEIVDDGIHRGFGYVRSDQMYADALERPFDTSFQLSLGNQANSLGLQNRRFKGEAVATAPRELSLT